MFQNYKHLAPNGGEDRSPTCHLRRATGLSRSGPGCLDPSSLNSQRNLAQMVFSKRLVRLAGFFQPKRSVHVDFKWTRIDQGVESVDECRAIFSIVRLNGDTVRNSRLRHYAMWIRDSAHLGESLTKASSVSSPPAVTSAASIPLGANSLAACRTLTPTSIDCTVSSQFFGKLHTVVTGSDGEHIGTETFGEL